MEITGMTKVLGVFGNPIKHTLSPAIHNTLSEKLNIDAKYLPFHVEGDLDYAVRGAYMAGVSGLNITVPFKQEVMKSLVDIDEMAKQIGAVNTLVRAEGGFKGYNTDMPGLYRALTKLGVVLQGKKAIMLGAGGAARAVAMMLVKYGAEKVYILNRSIEKAESIAELSNIIQPMTLSEYKDIPKDSYLFFQCTSLGLKEGDGLLIDDSEFYKMAEFGFDLIYNPAVTPFLARLNELGIPNSNGLGMLLYQGIIAYELWNDIQIDDETADYVMNVLCKKLYGDNIVLVGYMGSGKSTVGKELAKLTGAELIDTDTYIEEQEGCSIKEIFARSGEEAFRNIEREAIRKLAASRYNTIIATGGGAVIKSENREMLKSMGKVIYLKTSPEESERRLMGDGSRPLLKAEGSESLLDKIKRMQREREAYYVSASHKIIMTDGKSAGEIAGLCLADSY